MFTSGRVHGRSHVQHTISPRTIDLVFLSTENGALETGRRQPLAMNTHPCVRRARKRISFPSTGGIAVSS